MTSITFQCSLRHAFHRCVRTFAMPAVVAWLAGFGVLAVPVISSAELITVTGTITVDADDGASFKAGDTFGYSFTFNDATTDTSSSTFNAQFSAGVSAFSLTRDASNTGTWDPASGTFTVSPIANMSVNANGDSVTLQVRGSGFPDLNGVSFFDVGLSFGFGGVYDFVDTGIGQTFAQMAGVSPVNFALASFQNAEIRDTSLQGPTLSASVTVPEPATVVSLGGAAVLWMLIGCRRAAWRGRRCPEDRS